MTMNAIHRRMFLASTLAGGFLLRPRVVPAAPTEERVVSVTGESVSGAEAIDDLLRRFVAENHVPGAAVAVSTGGKTAYARGFGYADTERKESVQPDSLFRIASVSKPLTSVAVLQLVGEGKLSLDDYLLDILEPDPSIPVEDARWKQITIRQCLQHTGGWDSAKSRDPMAQPGKIAKTLGIEFPVTIPDIIRYMLGRPLDFDPGTRYAYSNFGYLLLGRIIERITGRHYEDAIKASVFAPLGITAPRLGRPLLEDRAPGEVRYYLPKPMNGTSINPPGIGQSVPFQYGAENFDAFAAHGGWIASATDLVRFAAAFDDPDHCVLLKRPQIDAMWARPPGLAGFKENGDPKPAYYGCGWSVTPNDNPSEWTARHAGRLAGTGSLLSHDGNRLNWSILLNTDANSEGKSLTDLIASPLAKAIREWTRTLI